MEMMDAGDNEDDVMMSMAVAILLFN